MTSWCDELVYLNSERHRGKQAGLGRKEQLSQVGRYVFAI